MLMPISPIADNRLRWYKQHRRDLPWRRTSDPYHIWVAETMLQQTQVETVIPYYERFLARWPTVEALAGAKLDDVLKMWEGLGYYARARNLHRGARGVVKEFGGQLPNEATALLQISGIGRYTAGAVASIAFGRDEPAVDGNIRRVLCRLFAVEEDPRTPAAQERLWRLAAAVLPAGRAGDFNQALMDLGSGICVARKPRCLLCPLQDDCQAFQRGLQERLPLKAARKVVPHHTIAVGVIWKRGRILIAQRKADDLLGGLWEFAGGKQERGETLEACCRREIREELGVTVRVRERIATVEHAYTHFRVTIHAFNCDYVRGTPKPLEAARARWVWPSELGKFAWPAANKRIIEKIMTAKRG
ncbi:MAG: A/G-specific adenine glycosylase [Chloroflexi bacterium]|nr:A/G-specific adenine glycosylase [Chloroflexota bacterium]